MIRRPPRSTLSSSSAASDVYKRQLLDNVGSLRSEVPFIDHSGRIHQEGHDSGVAVLGRIGDECEATRHLAIHDVAFGATLGLSALSRQDPVVVAVERLRSIVFASIALAGGIGYQGANRALGLPLGNLPIKSVLLAFIANELLRVLVDGIAIMRLLKIIVLSIGQDPTHANGCHLILTDTTEEDFLHSGLAVEIPLAD